MKISRLLSLCGIVAMLLGMTVIGSGASSHREAPLISQDQVADNTDVYAFVSPDRPDTVTLIANFIPLQVPGAGPYFYNFGDDVMYKINIDNDGDAIADIEYQFRFQTNFRNANTFLYNTGPIRSLDDPNWNLFQTYDVARAEFDNEGNPTRDEVIGGYLKVPPYNIGPKSTPNYDALANAAIFTTGDGTRIFAGPRDDSFFIDVAAIFDLLTIRRPPGNMGGGVDGLANLNVHSIALQIPKARLSASGAMPSGPTDPNAIIGVWATTERLGTRVLPGQSRRGDDEASGEDDPQRFRQVSRLGHPLVNEVVVPTAFKDIFNASQPRNDAAFLPVVQNPEAPRLLNALYGINVPPAPRNDLVQVFLTGIPGANQPANVRPSEQLRLNMMVPPSANPNRMGVLGGDMQGFPNGRRLTDDVPDIELRVLAGVLVEGFNVAPNNQLGDGVDANDKPFSPNFPYVVAPEPGVE